MVELADGLARDVDLDPDGTLRFRPITRSNPCDGAQGRGVADWQGITAIGLIILTVWPPSFGVKMVGYFLLWTSNAAGPILIVSFAAVSPCSRRRRASADP